MGMLSDSYSKMKEYLTRKNAEINQAQSESEARPDWETTDKALRNTRRQVQKYRDKDEKAQLEAYLRQRQAQEDRSWMNPYGMLENQEINLSQDRNNNIMTQPNLISQSDLHEPTNNILNVPNTFNTKSSGRKRK